VILARRGARSKKAPSLFSGLQTSTDVEGRSGLYFNGHEESRADAQAYDLGARQRLKRLSLELTSLQSRRAASLTRTLV
jgi:hypothetical protein